MNKVKVPLCFSRHVGFQLEIGRRSNSSMLNCRSWLARQRTAGKPATALALPVTLLGDVINLLRTVGKYCTFDVYALCHGLTCLGIKKNI